MSYAGHLARDGNKWNKAVEEWTPLDVKRKRGRSVVRWRDEIVKVFGNEMVRYSPRQKNLETDSRGLCSEMGGLTSASRRLPVDTDLKSVMLVLGYIIIIIIIIIII